MSTSLTRNRDDWARMMDVIIQAIAASLERTPEVPPAPLSAPPNLPALEGLTQRLARLQSVVEQAEELAQTSDRELEAAANVLRRWFGQEGWPVTPPAATSP